MSHKTNLNEDGVPLFEAACTGTTNLSSCANSVCVCVCVCVCMLMDMKEHGRGF
jgi:hypothetical protein